MRPQLLIDPKGYYRLTRLEEFETIGMKFNYLINDILGLKLPSFFYWKAKRIEYAADLFVGEEFIPKYLLLFKKGYIQDYLLDSRDTQKYWNSNTNVYLVSPNKTVNWYYRFETLLIKEAKSPKEFYNYSETRGILRFETQVRNSNELVIDVLSQKKEKKKYSAFTIKLREWETFTN